MSAIIPLIKGPNHADPFGIGRPYREIDTLDALYCADVGAQFFIAVNEISLDMQIHFILGQGQREAIGIFNFVLSPERVDQNQAVGKGFCVLRKCRLKKTSIINARHWVALTRIDL